MRRPVLLSTLPFLHSLDDTVNSVKANTTCRVDGLRILINASTVEAYYDANGCSTKLLHAIVLLRQAFDSFRRKHGGFQSAVDCVSKFAKYFKHAAVLLPASCSFVPESMQTPEAAVLRCGIYRSRLQLFFKNERGLTIAAVPAQSTTIRAERYGCFVSRRPIQGVQVD